MSLMMVEWKGAVMAASTLRTRIGGRFLPWVALGAAASTLGAAAVLAPAAAHAAPVPVPICNEMGGQAGPDVAGSMVVWTDNRNGNLDIYGRNLSTRTNVAVCTNDAQQDNPSIARVVEADGTHFVAVWLDARNHSGGDATDIYGRDITAKNNFVVARSASAKWYPEIVDNWVVWLEGDSWAGPFRVKARDLTAAKTYLIATTKTLSPVAVDSRTVGTETVYTAVYTSGVGDISGRDLPRGTPFVVSQSSKFEWMPDISHDRVVWWEDGGRIMLKDLASGKRSFVHLGSRPRIDHDLVVWDGGGHGGSFTIDYTPDAKVYVRNLAGSAKPVVIAQPHLTCLFPAVSGTRVVWESGPAKRVLSHIHIYGVTVR